MVSIIVVTKNSDTLERCIATIKNETVVNYEIIVVNAGKRIDFDAIPDVRFRNEGETITTQIEAGYKAAVGEYVVAFCDDHFPLFMWLTEALNCFEENFPDGYGMVCLNEMRNWKGSKACVVLTTKKHIEKNLGGIWYDTKYKHYFCDDDLYWRAKDKGYVYCEEAKIHHDHKGQNIMSLWNPDEAEFKGRNYGN